MPVTVSRLSEVASSAELGDNVVIGPFCVVGPQVRIGEGTILESHVTIVGNTTIGRGNRFFPNCVIGGEPQDLSFRQDADTRLEIGDENIFREGVTVSRGAEKEDHCTRIGHRNMLMANAHVAHNCHIHNHSILVNGVLLGGHVCVQDRAIISGNSVVHHFATLGTLSFVSGGCRVPTDVPPFMLASGSDNPEIKTINLVGMRRAGIAESTIAAVKRCHRLIYREHRKFEEVRDIVTAELDGVIPYELSLLFNALEQQQAGRMGRAREALRDRPQPEKTQQDTQQRQRRAA